MRAIKKLVHDRIELLLERVNKYERELKSYESENLRNSFRRSRDKAQAELVALTEELMELEND